MENHDGLIAGVCDPLIDNNIPCTCQDWIGLSFSIFELFFYFVATVIFLYKTRRSKHSLLKYAVSAAYFVGFTTHFVETLIIYLSETHCKEITLAVNLINYGS